MFIQSINYWLVILNHPKGVNSRVKLAFITTISTDLYNNLNAAVMLLLKGLMTKGYLLAIINPVPNGDS